MKAGKTIAIIGDTGKFCPALAEKLTRQNLRLLFVSNDEEKNAQIMKQLEQKDSSAEIEFFNCEKEGCWEADVIAFTYPEKIKPELLQRIKDVATQKVVLIVSEKNDNREVGGNHKDFEELLPHSRVVRVVIDVKVMEVTISGKDDEARKMIQGFFEDTN